MEEMVKQILRHIGIDENVPCNRIRSGFNRSVFDIDNKYILKICTNVKRESDVRNEVSFFINNDYDFSPGLLVYDNSKTVIPYYYTIEEKIQGHNLFSLWGDMSEMQRYRILDNLVNILRIIHSKPYIGDYDQLSIMNNFNNELAQCKRMGLFSKEEIKYLLELSNSFEEYLKNARCGYIHGDVHFDNIIVSEDGLKLIDFEWYGPSIIDKEFDALNRMSKNPNSFISNGSVNPDDYKNVMSMLRELYPEVMNNEILNDRLLIFDCYNAIKWISIYPDHERYHQVLFDEGAKLIRKK
jgi:hypothetical protein